MNVIEREGAAEVFACLVVSGKPRFRIGPDLEKVVN